MRKDNSMHPLAFTDSRGGFTDGNDRKVVAGDRDEFCKIPPHIK